MNEEEMMRMKKIEKSHNYIKKRHKYEKSESILRK